MGLLVVLVMVLFFLAELLAALCNSSDGAGASVVWLAGTAVIRWGVDGNIGAVGLQGEGGVCMAAARVDGRQTQVSNPTGYPMQHTIMPCGQCQINVLMGNPCKHTT